VGIYARISSDREGDELGVRRQLADCERRAVELGWAVAERYVDDDVSAWSGKRRPEYQRLLADLAAGGIEGMVVYHLDRLHRHPRELEEFFEVVRAAGASDTIATVTGRINLADPDGQFQARILGAVAKKESDDKSRRIRRKHEELAAAGKVSGGGHRPFGYEADKIALRPAEAAVVRDCAERVLAGESLRKLAIDLNAHGITTSTGGRWVQGSLRRILISARISGQREHHGDIIGKAEWPPIITPAQTAQIRAILTDPSRRTNQAPRSYLLHGLLACSHCGERLVARPRAGGQRRYACAKGPGFSGCGKTYINAEGAERFIADAVLHRIDSPEVAASVEGRPSDPDLERWHDQLEADQAQLVELAQAYGEKQLTLAEMIAARKPIDSRITEAKKQLSRNNRSRVLNPYFGQGEQLRADWNNLDLDQQHAIAAAVIDHVIVGPGRRGYNRFEPSRLTPVFRP
jgi:DNA invertase Pin-like site-specific DNA recombinase